MLCHQVSFIVEPTQEGVDKDDIVVEAVGVTSKAPVTVSWMGGKGHGKFTPTEPGVYKVRTASAASGVIVVY